LTGCLEGERRVSKIEFGVGIGFFREDFNDRVAKEELEKACI
jgi:hypothetical protein